MVRNLVAQPSTTKLMRTDEFECYAAATRHFPSCSGMDTTRSANKVPNSAVHDCSCVAFFLAEFVRCSQHT